jgi:hypothetical protein
MGTLTGKQIDNTYDGLIKTNDEQPINATPKTLQDGLGNDLPVQVGTGGMVYSGSQDFTAATVTGISGTDTTYTLGVDESVPDGVITLQASDGSPIQEVTFQCDGNIVMDTAVGANTLDVFVAPYELSSAQDGNDVSIILESTYGDSELTLEAGTNITITNAAGSNNIVIDAAGGGGGGTFISPLSPARQYKTTTNNFWNFAMPQDGNNYDGGGLSSQIDFAAGRRYFTQIYSDTVSEFAILFGPDFTGAPFAELWDVWPTTGMPRNRIAITGTWLKGSQGNDKAWWTGSFDTETLNYEKYYIAFGSSTNPGAGNDFQMYSALQAGGYINRLVEINVSAQQPDTQNAIDYVGGGMNDAGNIGATAYPEDYNFSFRIDMFNTILIKQ